MKLRNTAAAAVAAFALVLSLPASALAATGDFHYKFRDQNGVEQTGTLHDPESDRCINLDEVGSNDADPGYAPHNRTDSWVTVYLGADCDGPDWRLRPDGRPATEWLLVRSVRFDVND